MHSDGSITRYMAELRQGDRSAAAALWRRYWERATRAARSRLADYRRRVADEEDAAQSAFAALFAHMESERPPDLKDREDLWNFLATLVRRKAAHQRRDLARLKRGGPGLAGESVFEAPAADEGGHPLGQVPDPRAVWLSTQLDLHCEQLLEALPEEGLRQIAVWKLEGDSSQEIAEKLDVTVRTIERKLARIRAIWNESDPPSDADEACRAT